MIGAGRISSQTAGIETSNVMATNVAEEARNALSAGDNRACSDGESREDKCSNDMSSTESRVCLKKPICYRHGQEREKELL